MQENPPGPAQVFPESSLQVDQSPSWVVQSVVQVVQSPERVDQSLVQVVQSPEWVDQSLVRVDQSPLRVVQPFVKFNKQENRKSDDVYSDVGDVDDVDIEI